MTSLRELTESLNVADLAALVATFRDLAAEVHLPRLLSRILAEPTRLTVSELYTNRGLYAGDDADPRELLERPAWSELRKVIKSAVTPAAIGGSATAWGSTRCRGRRSALARVRYVSVDAGSSIGNGALITRPRRSWFSRHTWPLRASRRAADAASVSESNGPASSRRLIASTTAQPRTTSRMSTSPDFGLTIGICFTRRRASNQDRVA